MSTVRFTPLLVSAAIFSLATCNPAPRSGSVVRDGAGVRIVENDHTVPAWGDRPWTIPDSPAVQIGAVESRGPDQLYGVTHSRLLSNGDIAIVNSRTQEVRIFDGLGGYRRTIGRRGDGPGEFQSPWQTYPLPGDSLLVIDLCRAVSVFDGEGNYVRRFVPGRIRQYLGAIVLPAGFVIHHIARGKVIGRWTDEFDVEYVRVYEIENHPSEPA